MKCCTGHSGQDVFTTLSGDYFDFDPVIFHLRENANLEKRINIGLIVLSLMESIILYAFAGQPGFFGDRLFVIMKNNMISRQHPRLMIYPQEN